MMACSDNFLLAACQKQKISETLWECRKEGYPFSEVLFLRKVLYTVEEQMAPRRIPTSNSYGCRASHQSSRKNCTRKTETSLPVGLSSLFSPSKDAVIDHPLSRRGAGFCLAYFAGLFSILKLSLASNPPSPPPS